MEKMWFYCLAKLCCVCSEETMSVLSQILRFEKILSCVASLTSRSSLAPSSVPLSLPVYLSAYSFPKMPASSPSDCLLPPLYTHHCSLSLSTSFCVLFIRQALPPYFPSACFTICLHLTPLSWLSAKRCVFSPSQSHCRLPSLSVCKRMPSLCYSLKLDT